MSDLVRALERGYELLWREGEVERVLGRLPADFEWVVPGHPEGDVRRGPESTIAFFRDWVEPWDDLQVEWELEPAGPDRVLALLTMRGTGRESGAPAEMHAAQLWTYRDGVAVRMVLYYDVDEARRAAGM